MVTHLTSCRHCGEWVDRVDHLGLERFILDPHLHLYRDLAIPDGDGRGGPGVASEIRLCCGYCGAELDLQQREHFYRHWIRAAQALAALKGPP